MIPNTTTEIGSSTPDVSILSQTQYRVYDCLLAAGLCLCFLIGLPGNCLSLTYFIRSRKRNLPTLLYITACSIDIVSSVIHLPVTANLFNRRRPGLLGNKGFCGIWYFFLVSVQQISMFIVMTLSITRAIVIFFPFYRIRRKTVFIFILLTLIYTFFWNSVYTINGEYYYSTAFSYCGFDDEQNMILYVYNINYSLLTGFPPIAVFIAMTLSIVKLGTQKSHQNDKNRRNASMTMIYFSAVFLVCNMLTFLNNALLTYSDFSDKGYTYFYKNPFLFFYSWQLSEIFCTVLNAAINPILYIFRFKELRAWLFEILNLKTSMNEQFTKESKYITKGSFCNDKDIITNKNFIEESAC